MLTLNELPSSTLSSRRLLVRGTVVSVQGPLVSARMPLVGLGELCTLHLKSGTKVRAVVVGFHESLAHLAPLETVDGLSPGSIVESNGERPSLRLPPDPLGGVYDVFGSRLDGPSETWGSQLLLPLHRSPPAPLARRPISEPFITGIKCIDGLLTLGVGQRVGLFAGPGVGKSTLLGALARNCHCDVVVVALVGERGREVREFLEDSLHGEGRTKSIVVVATSDESAIRRSLAAHSATAIAEHYRAQGKRVLLLVDSLTRVARAIREVSLAAGEVPVRQGYTPSVYAELPRLLERSGNDEFGSITALYTVLTNADDESDPLAEESKSLLDGHLSLDARIADQGIRPAIDPLRSISRLMPRITSAPSLEASHQVRKALGRLRKDKDLILFGGTPDEELKRYLKQEHEILSFLQQTPNESIPHHLTERSLVALAQTLAGVSH